MTIHLYSTYLYLSYRFLYHRWVLSTLKYHRSCHPNWTTTQKKTPEITDIINSKLERQQRTINIRGDSTSRVLPIYTNQHYNQLSQLSSELYDLFLESSQQKKKKMILSSMLCADSSSSKFNFLTHFSRPSTGSNVSL